jgi:hypothetical protein
VYSSSKTPFKRFLTAFQNQNGSSDTGTDSGKVEETSVQKLQYVHAGKRIVLPAV